MGVDLIRWVSSASGVELRQVGHSAVGRVRGIAFTPDGRRLVVGSFDGTSRSSTSIQRLSRGGSPAAPRYCTTPSAPRSISTVSHSSRHPDS
jgi:WD40 repeat protein